MKQKAHKTVSTVSVRYMIEDGPSAIAFYTTHLDFIPSLGNRELALQLRGHLTLPRRAQQFPSATYFSIW
jgi:hypothetical protein